MKTNFVSRWLNSLVVGVFLLAGLLVSQNATAESYNGVSFQVFYDELAPYGDWVRDARHGYIWLPAVDQNFHPYGTDGHWVMTEYGNTWVSYFDWGWAPFHYGRWYFDDYFRSWAWIPGYQWGPAWVSWRTGGGYYGWAPLGPGASFNMIGNYSSFHWVFLPRHRIYHHHAYRYYAPHRTRVRIYNNTTIINNTYVYNNQTYVTGPSRRELQQVTRRNVPVYQVQASNTPGRTSVSRNTLNVYRPEVQESRDRTVGARPSRILEADQARGGRSSQVLNAPSRTSAASGTSGGRTLESPSRSSINTDGTVERTTPSRSSNPAVNQGTQRPVITPMPDDSRSRSTYTAPSRVQSSGSREEAPARSTQVRPTPNPSQRTTAAPSRPSNEVRNMEQRTQPSAPARESVQQSRPAQAPARTQVQERAQTPARVQAPVNRSEPARTQVTQPSRIQSGGNSSEVKAPAPARQSAPAAPSTSGSTPSRSSGRGN